MKIFARSDVGRRRPTNEDIIVVHGWNSREQSGRLGAPIQAPWVLLADGMGGHAHGEVASELAVELLGEMLPTLCSGPRLQNAISAVHRRLHELMLLHEDLEGMGTTIVGLISSADGMIGFNVGDSRLYHWSAGVLRRVSIDDSEGHILTQCLGGFEASPPVAHVFEWTPTTGERLLLCSDGLTDLVADRTIQETLERNDADPADALVEAALAAGGYDNVSVVVAEP